MLSPQGLTETAQGRYGVTRIFKGFGPSGWGRCGGHSVLGSRDIWQRTFTSQLREGEAEVPQRDRALESDFCQLGLTISSFQMLPK